MGLFGGKHSIGKTIAELRKQKGWTQLELAEKLQVSDKAVSKWEQENGAPSIEFFPMLAELFDVSIDYLMTGKTVEPEIVTMSKAELCAKENRPELVKEIDCTHRDEKGKSLIRYILEYESLDVFVELCTINKDNIRKFKIADAVKLCILSNRLDLLNKATFGLDAYARFVFDTPKQIFDLLPQSELENFKKGGKESYACVLPDSLFQMIASDKRINDQTLDFILGKQTKGTSVWFYAFPYIIHHCYSNNNEKLLSRLLMLTKENNVDAYINFKKATPHYMRNRCDYFRVGHYMPDSGRVNTDSGHGFVRILEKTTRLALDRGDFQRVSDFTEINSAVINYGFKCYVPNDDEIRIAKLKSDTSVSADEIVIQSTIHDGVVCIDELLETNDFDTIKNTLEKHPIHIMAYLYDLLKSGEYRKLFRFAIDKGNIELADAVSKSDFDTAQKRIQEYWKPDGCINVKHLYIMKNGRKEEVFPNTSRSYGQPVRNITLEACVEKLQQCKQRIIDEISLKLDKTKLTQGLTKAYFEEELNKGNVDIVIIKLCVCLEAILRCDYGYQGDLLEMLNKYCSQWLTWTDDDGWGYMEYRSDSKTIDALQNLRKKRNNIVHAEKSEVELSVDDIRHCINHIFKMNKE